MASCIDTRIHRQKNEFHNFHHTNYCLLLLLKKKEKSWSYLEHGGYQAGVPAVSAGLQLLRRAPEEAMQQMLQNRLRQVLGTTVLTT